MKKIYNTPECQILKILMSATFFAGSFDETNYTETWAKDEEIDI